MIRLIGLWLVGCSLCVTPVAADEDVYDGPTAIKPLTVTPLPQHASTSRGYFLRSSIPLAHRRRASLWPLRWRSVAQAPTTSSLRR
jgi:hypothetical protein